MPLTKTKLDKNQAVSIVSEYLEKLESLIENQQPIKASDITEFVSNNYTFTTNGQQVCRSANEYANRLNKLQKKYARMQMSSFIEDPIFENNKLAVYYTADLIPHSGQKKQVFLQGVATLEDNKISSWQQVVCEKGGSDWDK